MISASELNERLERILPGVSKPARYTGGELNAVIKEHDSVDFRFAMAFPDAYEIGMSNLACSIIYNLLNHRADTVCERVFAPWPDMEESMRRAEVPLFSIETRTPITGYDMIGFALSFELSFTNVLNMLDLAGMPVRSLDRDGLTPDGKPWPLVIAGGHSTFNPEPMAPFIDIFVIGEAEAVLPGMVEAFKLYRELPREDLLLKMAALPGCYVPRFYEPIYETADQRVARLEAAGLSPEEAALRHDTMPHLLETRRRNDAVPSRIARQWVKDVDALDFPTEPIIPYIEIVHDRISLEVMRGCTRGCRFCQAGMVTRPVREKSPEVLLKQADLLVRSTGHEDISLVSLSTADYSRVGDVVRSLINEYAASRIGVSLPSLRADKDCVALVQEINKVRKTGLTFAPEAGSQRMRDVTNKGVTEENLFTACDSAFQNGWQRVKLYFMISLPTETDEDVLAIGELAGKCAALGRRAGVRNVQVNIGVSAFVPKPFTPFQWHGQDTAEEIDRKQRLLKRNLRDRAVNYRPNEPRSTRLEALLSLGDRRIADVIERTWRAGAKFEAWDEYLNVSLWDKSCEELGIDQTFVANRAKGYDETFAWDHIDCGVTKGYLRAEDKRARQGRLTADCHTEPCTFCMACDRGVSERRGKADVRLSEVVA